MLDQLHNDDLPLNTQDHLIGLDVRIAQAHSAGVDERPWDDLDGRPLTGLVVNSQTNAAGCTLANELVESPVTNGLGIIVMTLLLPLQT